MFKIKMGRIKEIYFPHVFNRPDLDNRANHPPAIKNQLRSDKVTESHKLCPIQEPGELYEPYGA